MTGTLGLFSLVDLFQLIAASSRTGRLGVYHPEGTARVYFDQGQAVHAEFKDFQGEAAVYALFADEQGSFEFQMGLPAPQKSVGTSTENLLLEVIRRLDEARRDGDEAPGIASEAVPAFHEGGTDATRLTLEAQEQKILSLIDGRHDVSEIAVRAQLSIGETKRVIARLVKAGVVKMRSRKPRTARLVAQLTHEPLPPGVVAVETNIFANWERSLGHAPEQVACRRANGRVDIFEVRPLDSVGPYLLFSRETLFTSDIGVNVTLLVKPYVPARERTG